MAAERLTLGDDMRLMIAWYDGSTVRTREIGLGALGQSVQGESFVIVWEDGSHQGPPVAAPYPFGLQVPVPGIKVEDNFFDGIDASPSEVRITGSRNRVSGLLVILPRFTTDRVEDVVLSASRRRIAPRTGGQFASDGSLNYPTGSGSLQRRSCAGGPVDTDAESDWGWGFNNWGAPTP